VTAAPPPLTSLRGSARRFAPSLSGNGSGGDGPASIPIAVRDVTVAYEEKPVLWDVDLDVPPASLMAIIGPNGAGKSTLIKAILGLVPMAAGSVSIFGKPYAAQRRLVGYVPQRGSVDWDFPTNALDVVMMGLYGRIGWVRRPGRRERQIALDCLEKLGMAAFAKRQISQLSGGQQQRVFLARALAQDTPIYLMDEPFAGVDATTERAIIGCCKPCAPRAKPWSSSTTTCKPPRNTSITSPCSTFGWSRAARWRRHFPPTTYSAPTAARSPFSTLPPPPRPSPCHEPAARPVF
jgi:manganese/zinc/iron transport system ATP- binding protein